MKNKELFICALMFIISFVMWYLGLSFVMLEFDVANWALEIRLLMVLLGLITSAASIGIYRINFVN